ncbi:MAG TPA: type II toxin-antitoxin system PemK/MazF family toxin, partial [Candidatus Tumulicola sp.]
GREDLFRDEFGFLMVLPLTSDAHLRIAGATVEITPSRENLCSRTSYALSWNVQTVAKRRIRHTEARVSDEQLQALRNQIAALVDR